METMAVCADEVRELRFGQQGMFRMGFEPITERMHEVAGPPRAGEAEERVDDDVRWGKVRQLRAAIAEGRFAVPAGELAERLIERMLEED